MLPSSATAVGEQWTVRVTPNDGYSDGDYTEQSLVIEDGLPNVTA